METICYSLTPAALDKLYIETGKRHQNPFRLEMDPVQLTPDQRAILVEVRKFFPPWHRLELADLKLRRLFSKGELYGTARTYDAEPTIEQIFADLKDMIRQGAECEAARPALLAEIAREKAEAKAAMAKVEAQWRAEQEARKAKDEEERQARMVIPWNGDKAVVDLKNALFAAADVEIDERFNSWARTVTGINRDADNGFTFLGDFVDRGTVEIAGRDTKRVYLVAGTHGSRRNQTTEYRIVMMVAGHLMKTDIETNDSKPGWALRIRDEVAALLK